MNPQQPQAPAPPPMQLTNNNFLRIILKQELEPILKKLEHLEKMLAAKKEK